MAVHVALLRAVNVGGVSVSMADLRQMLGGLGLGNPRTLLQSGNAADLAGAFGGMGSQTVFGPRGSTTVLSKVTAWAAVTFMVTSLALTIVGNQTGGATPSSVLDNRLKTAPTAPAKKSTPIPQSGKPGGTGNNPAPAQQAPKK